MTRIIGGRGRTPGGGGPGMLPVNKQNDTVLISKLKTKNRELKDVIENNEKTLDELKTRVTSLEKILSEMFYYSPNGEGYKEAKTHFDKIKK